MDKIILIYGFMWEHLQKDTGVESMNKYDFITELQSLHQLFYHFNVFYSIKYLKSQDKS